MNRVVHLLGREPDFQTERAMASLRREIGQGFDIISRLVDHAGNGSGPAQAVLALRRGQFDFIHAWDERALSIAAVASSQPILYSPSTFPTRRSIRWLRAIMAYRNVQVICPTATLQRVMVENGVRLDRCHLLRPGVEFGRVRRRRDHGLRKALGLSDDDHVLLAVGESTRAARHTDTVWAASILHVLDAHQKVLLWGRGEHARRAANLGRQLNQPELVLVAEQQLGRRMEFEELLPAADAAVVSAAAPVTTLPIAICMAAALPIVATVTYTVAELLEDRHTALMTPRRVPRQLAQRILDLRRDSQLQWSISDMARTEAYEYFSHTRFMSQYRAIYQQLATGEPVSVTQPSPGAGLRFHGIA